MKACRGAEPKALVLVVPVAPAGTIEELRWEAAEILCVATPNELWAVGLYHEEFHQVGDDEVIALLKKSERAEAKDEFSKVPAVPSLNRYRHGARLSRQTVRVFCDS